MGVFSFSVSMGKGKKVILYLYLLYACMRYTAQSAVVWNEVSFVLKILIFVLFLFLFLFWRIA